MGKSDRHKSIIKLPLGINCKNKRRCLFLNENNENLNDQGIFLRTIKKNSVEQINDILFKQQHVSQEKTNKEELEIPPDLENMITKCHVIKHMIEKAKATTYLNHYERIILLYTLSFAGKPGNNLLHKIIGYCVNYNQQYTQHQIDKRKSKPISCPKISEYFPELVETVKCNCKFKHKPIGSYPSPVLYLLESELEQANSDIFNKQSEIKPEQENKKEDKMQDKKQAYAESNTNKSILDFETLFSSEISEPDINLQKVDEISEIPEKHNQDKTENTTEISKPDIPPVSETMKNSKTKSDINELVLTYLNLKHKQSLINKKVKIFEQKIEHAVKKHNTNIIENDFAKIEIVQNKLRIRYEYNIYNR